ncbi:MAG: VWA domain-containing protein [Archangium sp.]|nr:VWA domain-containing protein [Archangium sp.]
MPCDSVTCPELNELLPADPGPVMALPAAPDVVWVVDRSASMAQAIEPQSQCPENCGINGRGCPLTCATRWASVRRALEGVLNETASTARHAMLIFPSDGQCSSTPRFNVAPADVDDETTRLQRVDDAKRQLTLKGPFGGSPQAEALGFIAGVEALRGEEREHLVVLVTDGLPNCNERNPNTCAVPEACRCTSLTCGGSTCATGCLDDAATMAAMTALRASGQQLVMLGVGGDLAASETQLVFTRLAITGGARRACTTDSACGPNGRCVVAERLCASPTWWLKTAADADVIAQHFTARIAESSRCRYVLQPHPSVTSATRPLLNVFIDGAPYRLGNGWAYESEAVIRLTGRLCASALAGADVTVSLP